MKTVTRLLLLGAILIGLAVALVIGCGGGDDSDGDSSASNGSIQVKVTDAPNLDPNTEHVWITIDSVEVHREGGGWVEVMPNAYVSAPLTIDLLAWRSGSTKTLGLDSLPAGHYTQIRLNLGEVPEGGLDNPHPYANYVVIGEGGDPGNYELTVPSGYTSGLKLTHEFDIQADTTYEIVLDIDTLRIHRTGSGKYMLKPTIRAIEADLTGTITGTVATEACEVTVENVTVMAQVQDDPNDPTSVRVVQADLTVTGSEGAYTLAFLPPGTYTVVAYKDQGEDGVAVGVLSEVEVVAGEETSGADITMDCYGRDDVQGSVVETGVPAGQEDEITPIVTIFVSNDPNHPGLNYIIAIVGVPWSGQYWFVLGLPWAADAGVYEGESDLGTVTFD
jgi:hypothetical protein